MTVVLSGAVLDPVKAPVTELLMVSLMDVLSALPTKRNVAPNSEIVLMCIDSMPAVDGFCDGFADGFCGGLCDGCCDGCCDGLCDR